MLLPFVSAYGYSVSLFGAGGLYASFHLILLLAVVGLGAAYWFTNQKWAYLSAGIGALVVALLGIIKFFHVAFNDFVSPSIGACMLGLVSIGLGAAGGLLLMELKAGAVAPINNPNAFGGAFAGVQMGQQQGQFGQQPGQQQPQQPQLGDKPYKPFGPQA